VSLRNKSHDQWRIYSEVEQGNASEIEESKTIHHSKIMNQCQERLGKVDKQIDEKALAPRHQGKQKIDKKFY